MGTSGGTWWCVCTQEGNTVLARFKSRADALVYLREHDRKPSVSYARLWIVQRSW